MRSVPIWIEITYFIKILILIFLSSVRLFACSPLKLIDASGNDALQTKSQKRRAPLLLKRKALTTGFFDSSKIKSDGRKGSASGSTHSGGGGLIFGQPLEKCLSNDNAMSCLMKSKTADDSVKFSRNSRSSITSLDAQLPVGSGMSSDGTYVSERYFYS